jgi:predicted outer membrane repeat protein
MTNCTFIGNSAYEGGGICGDGDLTLTNCTFTGNSADRNGGGICGDADLALTNCIVWGNTASKNGNEIALVALLYSPPMPTIDVNYCDVKGGQSDVYVEPNCILNWGPGNIDADPCFVKPGHWGDVHDPNIPVEPNDPNAIWIDGNYRLLSGSPCIDAGDNSSVPADYADLDGDGNAIEPTPLDLDGFERFIDDLCIADTGNGTPPIVDMGAYEFLRSDINHNGSVNFEDFALFALQWLETDCGECYGAELTCDGQVEWADLRKLVEWWLAGTTP